MTALTLLVRHLRAATPLFAVVFAGYAARRWLRIPASVSKWLARAVFVIAIPALLFRLMSGLRHMPPVDARLLIAFFGGCLLVFIAARIIAWRVFALDGTGQSVFALGGIFSNTVLLGLPLAKATLGDAALPSVAMVLVFNALILWTLVTVSVEWAEHGSFTPRGLLRTAASVVTNPVVATILGGTLFGLAGLTLPTALDRGLGLIGEAAGPLALLALGMGLTEYDIGEHWRLGSSIAAVKLVAMPLAVWLLAVLLHLPPLETNVIVLLGSTATGVNVYLMAHQFDTLRAPVAACLVISTLMAALTTPLWMTLLSLLS